MAIVGALKERLGLQLVVAPKVIAAANTEAHDAYLRGRYLVVQRTDATVKGAVGEFVAHLIDETGQLCDVQLNNRLVSLEPDEVAKIPKTVGIAAGEEKAVPVRAILNGRYLSSLVVDEATATTALNPQKEFA